MMQITPEIIVGTPTSNIRGVEWFETGGGCFARVNNGLDIQWRMYVEMTSGGWALGTLFR